MRKILWVCAISMALISCQKQPYETNQELKKSINIDGKEYPIELILENMSKSTGIPIDSLEFHEDTKLFGIKGYYPNLNPRNYISL